MMIFEGFDSRKSMIFVALRKSAAFDCINHVIVKNLHSFHIQPLLSETDCRRQLTVFTAYFWAQKLFMKFLHVDQPITKLTIQVKKGIEDITLKTKARQ